MKICSKCKIEKDFSCFYKDKRYSNGVSCWCIECFAKDRRMNRKPCKTNKDFHTKICGVCGLEKEVKEFSVSKYNNNGLDYRCKFCKRKYDSKNRKVYELNRYNNDINFKLTKLLRNRLRSAIKKNQKVGSAISNLSCSIDDLKLWIESQFQTGMTWENWGKGLGKWNIDHIIPLISFDLSDPKQVKRACHWFNLRPLWEEENISRIHKVEK